MGEHAVFLVTNGQRRDGKGEFLTRDLSFGKSSISSTIYSLPLDVSCESLKCSFHNYLNEFVNVN